MKIQEVTIEGYQSHKQYLLSFPWADGHYRTVGRRKDSDHKSASVVRF